MSDETPKYRLKIVGGCRPEELVRFRMQINGRQDRWNLTEGDDANVVFCNLDSKVGQSAWRQFGARESGVTRVALTSDAPPSGTQFWINRFPHSYHLSTLLDEIERTCKPTAPSGNSAASGPVQQASTGSPTGSATSIDPSSAFLRLLWTVSGDEPLAISSSGVPQVIVCPKTRRAYSLDWQKLSKLAASDADAIDTSHVTTAEMETIANEHDMIPRQFNELLWFAALQSSEGKPLGDPDLKQNIQLKRFPDFSNLYHRPEHVRIGVMMTYHSLLIDDIARRAAAPKGEVVNFYNACLCLDLVKPSRRSAAAKQVRKVSAARAGLFRSILAKLSQPEEAVG